MMDRRFAPGDTFRLSGINFRVVAGSKSGKGRLPAIDYVIQWHNGTSWISVGFDVVALLVDFLYENEDELYPPPTHSNSHPWTNYRGGKYVMDFLNRAVKHGHRAAIQHLEYEKSNKDATLFDGAA